MMAPYHRPERDVIAPEQRAYQKPAREDNLTVSMRTLTAGHPSHVGAMIRLRRLGDHCMVGTYGRSVNYLQRVSMPDGRPEADALREGVPVDTETPRFHGRPRPQSQDRR
jgi:hypothetical protein